MRCCRLVVLAASFAVAACGLVRPAALAQEANRPVAVVSLSPVKTLLEDTTYLLRACNVPEMGGLVNIMATQYTRGFDLTRPIGMTVTLEGQMPSALVFLPMADSEEFFQALAGIGIEPDDLGDGLFEINANGQLIYAKEAQGWMFVAQTEDALANLPADPSKLLGDFPKKYDIAVKIDVQALPAEMRDMVTEQMRIGFQRGMSEQRGQTEEERQKAEEMGEASMAQIEQLMSDTEQVVLGWAIDSASQKTYMDGGIQFVSGSQLAAQANRAQNLTSDYTEFNLPGAAAQFRATSEIAESDKAIAKSNLANSLSQIENLLDTRDEMSEDEKALVLKLIERVIKITEKTIDEGKFDGAGSVSVADSTLRILIGGRVADGQALAQELKAAIAELSNSSPNSPTVEFDYETYKGVTLHRAAVPVKIADPGAKKIFGNQLKLTIGTADKGFIFALDPTGDAAVKGAIDRMEKSAGIKASPSEGVVQLQQILQFAQAISPNSIVDNAVLTLQQYAGKDKITVNGRAIDRGGVYRMSIDEGVLRAIGAAAKSGAGGGGGF